jgi:hypothetical protein
MRHFLVLLMLIPALTFAQTRYDDVEPELEVEQPTNTQGDLNQNNQNSTVDSFNRNTTNVGAGSGSPMPVNTAIAPSLITNGTDTCLISSSNGVQIVSIGYSKGKYVQDEECNRRKDARMFNELGMTIAAVSRMCQNDGNWKAMFEAGTPCPVLVRGSMVFGKRAMLAMKTNPELYIPDYSESTAGYYDQVLGMGESDEVESDGSGLSISDRFRSSTSSDEPVE